MPTPVRLNLVGLDGNAFNLLGQFQRAARKQGWSQQAIDEVIAQATSSNYDHLLQILIEYTDPDTSNEEQE